MDTTEVPAETLEALAEDGAAGDPTVLLEALADLRANPLDVNAATAEELAQIPAFSPLLAQAIVAFRAVNGPFASLPEVQRVAGVTADVYLDARPYLRIGARVEGEAPRPSPYPLVPSVREVAGGLRYTLTQRVQRRLDTPAGFLGPDSARTFAGSPERLYTRLQARFRRQVSLNVTLEKDPGEPFGFDGQPGYDFASAHVGLTGVGRLDALVVGDYAAEFGQGLVLWRASGFGKGPDAARGPIRSGRGLRPYGSVEENRFFRGAAATLALSPSVYVSAFASRRRLDASFVRPDSLALADGVVTGLGADGLHRTATERARKDALGETLVGGAAEYRIGGGRVGGRVGAVGYRARFDAPLVAGDRPYEAFDFEGDGATMASVYADVRTRTIQGFGEVARAPSGAVGALGGVAADLGGGTEALVLARHYPRDFVTLHGYPFGERNGTGQNESGVYGGVRLRPGPALTVAAYVDAYRFPWLRFGVPRPSRGTEVLGFVEYRPRRWLRVYLQGRSEAREAGTEVRGRLFGSAVGGLMEETRQSLRLHAEYDANRRLRLRARIEGVRFLDGSDEAQAGVLFYQDVRWQALGPLRLDARLTLFDTDGFDARVYQFENDLTGVFAIPALSGRGARAYLLATLTPLDGLTVQAKLAATVFEDVARISSGPNTVEGDRVRDLGVQIRYTF